MTWSIFPFPEEIKGISQQKINEDKKSDGDAWPGFSLIKKGFLVAALYEPNIPEEAIRIIWEKVQLCKDTGDKEIVYEQLATNKKTPPEILTQIELDGSLSTKVLLASNTSTPTEVLEKLSKVMVMEVIEGVARNPKSSKETINGLLTHKAVKMGYFIRYLKNNIGNLPEDPKLQWQEIWLYCVSNSNISTKNLNKFLKTGGVYLEGIVANRGLSEEELKKIKNNKTAIKSYKIRALVGGHPQTTLKESLKAFADYEILEKAFLLELVFMRYNPFDTTNFQLIAALKGEANSKSITFRAKDLAKAVGRIKRKREIKSKRGTKTTIQVFHNLSGSPAYPEKQIFGWKDRAMKEWLVWDSTEWGFCDIPVEAGGWVMNGTSINKKDKRLYVSGGFSLGDGKTHFWSDLALKKDKEFGEIMWPELQISYEKGDGILSKGPRIGKLRGTALFGLGLYALWESREGVLLGWTQEIYEDRIEESRTIKQNDLIRPFQQKYAKDFLDSLRGHIKENIKL